VSYEDVILSTARDTYPVARRTNIGEKITFGILKEEWRNLRKKNNQGVWEDVVKPDGKIAKQVVVHVLVKESTMPVVGGGDELQRLLLGFLADGRRIPRRGEIVRLMFDRGGASQWIDAKKALDGQFKVGVLGAMNTTHAIRYSTNSFAELGRIDTQADIDTWYQSPANIQRKESLGRRGDLQLKDADTDMEFKAECLKAFHEVINVIPDVPLDQGDPFPSHASASVGASSDLF
jgi:hypothetical protein